MATIIVNGQGQEFRIGTSAQDAPTGGSLVATKTPKVVVVTRNAVRTVTIKEHKVKFAA